MRGRTALEAVISESLQYGRYPAGFCDGAMDTSPTDGGCQRSAGPAKSFPACLLDCVGNLAFRLVVQ